MHSGRGDVGQESQRCASKNVWEMGDFDGFPQCLECSLCQLVLSQSIRTAHRHVVAAIPDGARCERRINQKAPAKRWEQNEAISKDQYP